MPGQSVWDLDWTKC